MIFVFYASRTTKNASKPKKKLHHTEILFVQIMKIFHLFGVYDFPIQDDIFIV